jgi:hypothetical protein
MLENLVNIPVNSTISAMLKEASYIISTHDVSGTTYYCLMNGTDDRAGRLENYGTNASAVINNALGNLSGNSLQTIVIKGNTTLTQQLFITKSYVHLVFDTLIQGGNYTYGMITINKTVGFVQIDGGNMWGANWAYTGAAIYIDADPTSSTSTWMRVNNVYADRFQTGFISYGRKDLFYHCHAYACTYDGFEFLGSDSHATECLSEENGHDGFLINASYSNIQRCSADHNDNVGINITGAGHDNVLSGGYAEFSGYNGIWLNQTNFCNTIENLGILCNGQTAPSNGIYVNSSYNIIKGNNIFDSQVTPTQTYAIYLGTYAYYNKITLNDFNTGSGYTSGVNAIYISSNIQNLNNIENNIGFGTGTGMALAVNQHGSATTTIGVNKTFLTHVNIPKAGQITEFTFYLITASASQNITMSIWSDNTLSPVGGTLLWNATISAAVAGCKNQAVSGVYLNNSGTIWLGLTTSDAVVAVIRNGGNDYFTNSLYPYLDGATFTSTSFVLPSVCPAVTRLATSCAVIYLIFTPSY